LTEKQFNYKKVIDNTEFTVVISESATAKEMIVNKLKNILLKDLSDKVCSEGESK